jgi:anti-anti-sigma regulatory factor
MIAPLEFALPERLSVTEENALLPFLRANPEAPVDVSTARLRRIDTPLVQVLLAAAADRRARGVPFRLTGVSPDQAAQLSALGVTDALLNIQVAA